jgi:predicted transposase YbfD/YdcC
MTLLTEKRAARVVGRANLDFQDVKDPRAYCGKKIVPLPALMRLMVAGFSSGKMVLRSIEDFSGDMPSATRRLLKIPGSVSDTTLWGLLKRTDPQGFREILFQSLRRDLDSKAITNNLFPGGVVAYDGKNAGCEWGDAPNDNCRTRTSDGEIYWDIFALRACLVSSSAAPIIDQQLIPDKKGEPTTFPEMFKRDVERFPRLFRYITGDAGLVSASNAQLVIDHNKCYLYQIKGNFGVLYPHASALLTNASIITSTTDLFQGDVVVREIRRVSVPDDVTFPGATQFIAVRQIRTNADGTRKCEDRVYITSIPWRELSPKKLLNLVRLHWRIENGANWTADMIFEEDSRRPCNQGFGPNVVSWLLVLAYNLITTFRAHLPKKDRLPQSWERVRELFYQAALDIVGKRRLQIATEV